MRRIVVLGAAALAVVVLMAAGYAVAAGAGGHDAPAHAAVRSTRALTGLVPQAASATLPAEPMATSGPGKPNITLDLIRYGPRRRHEMAAYARRHYHVGSSRLHPK